eukprot:g48722.t1
MAGKKPRAGKAVICETTGVRYISYTEAARATGAYDASAVRRAVLTGDRAGGHRWLAVPEDEPETTNESL